MTEKQLMAEMFRRYPSIRYQHAPECVEALACDCEKPNDFHSSTCASLPECECNGKLVGVRFKH
jgi:hypothetical protein